MAGLRALRDQHPLLAGGAAAAVPRRPTLVLVAAGLARQPLSAWLHLLAGGWGPCVLVLGADETLRADQPLPLAGWMQTARPAEPHVTWDLSNEEYTRETCVGRGGDFY